MTFNATTYNLEANTHLQDIWDNAMSHGADTIILLEDRTEAFKLQMSLYKHRKAMVEQRLAGITDQASGEVVREILAPYQAISLRVKEGNLHFAVTGVPQYQMIDAETGEQV